MLASTFYSDTRTNLIFILIILYGHCVMCRNVITFFSIGKYRINLIFFGPLYYLCLQSVPIRVQYNFENTKKYFPQLWNEPKTAITTSEAGSSPLKRSIAGCATANISKSLNISGNEFFLLIYTSIFCIVVRYSFARF